MGFLDGRRENVFDLTERNMLFSDPGFDVICSLSQKELVPTLDHHLIIKMSFSHHKSGAGSKPAREYGPIQTFHLVATGK